MTPLPKKRHSTRRQGIRRNSIKLSLPSLAPCPNCHSPRFPHRSCPHCGYYKGVKVA